MEKKKPTRQLRDRKVRKLYTDDWPQGDADDEIEGPAAFILEEKLQTENFNKPHLIKILKGTEFNLSWIQQNGFTVPLLFKEKTGLGIRIPQPTFTVSDVRTLVGSRRLLDVMDVRTQKNMEMTMKEWEEYYLTPDKDRLLNVISLEFSHTKLENYVESPTVVRQLDWVDRVWPRHLKNMQTESTNVMDEMMYPKVQKYCLMSVAGCYTDFHVDFGGTSVWYHILRGSKVFWLIPPTDKNLELYQSWVLSGKQGEFFFGDNVQDCGRVTLEAGDTFFIPSGWIHAVHTPKDSLVFGGNFLHSFGIEKQLKIAMVEETTKVPQKFRYPFFTEMLWYTLERYVNCLIGLSYIRIPPENGEALENPPPIGPQIVKRLAPDDVHLSPQELLGLKAIVLYLHQLPLIRKNVPALIYDPVALLRSVRTIVEEHRYDNPQKAVTGKPILVWPHENPNEVGKIKPSERKRVPKFTKNNTSNNNNNINNNNNNPNNNNNSSSNQQLCPVIQKPPIKALQRVCCNICQSCTTTEDCKSCSNCLMNCKLKETSNERKNCLMRECMTPLLAPQNVCIECGKDGWNGMPSTTSNPKFNPPRMDSNLMECTKCFQIIHPTCVKTSTKGFLNEDLPCSWECPYCVEKSIPLRSVKRKSLEERRRSFESTQMNCSNNSSSMSGFPSIAARVEQQSNLSSSNNSNQLSNGISTSMEVVPPSSASASASTSHITIPNPAKQSHHNSLIKSEFSFGLRIDSSERSIENVVSSGEPPKSVRDDVKIVQEKLAQVVRRKSVEDLKGKSPMKPKSKLLNIKSALKLEPKSPPKSQNTNKSKLMNNKKNEESSDGNAVSKNIPINTVVILKRESSPDILSLPSKKKELAQQNLVSNNSLKKVDISKVKEKFDKNEPGKANSRRLTNSSEEKGALSPKKAKKMNAEESKKAENNLKDGDKFNNNESKNDKSPIQSPIKNHYRSELSNKIINSSTKVLKRPTYVVRPAFFKEKDDILPLKKKKLDPQDFLKSQYMLKVFTWLDVKSLNRCLSVSKDWNQLAVSPGLWQTLDLTHSPITPDLLKGCIRRQPHTVNFDWTNISKQQLLWIIARLPQLKELSLKGLNWNSVQALKTCTCPTLISLDLSYVGGLTDSFLREILAPPIDARSGNTDSKSRLAKLKSLSLAGASLSDVALRYVTQHAGSVTKLDLSCCSRITDAGIAQLGAPNSPSLENLTHLNISGCPQLTNISLDHLRRCRNMTVLDIRNIPMINYTGLTKYLSQVNLLTDKANEKTKRDPPACLTVHSDFHSMQKPKNLSTSNSNSNDINTPSTSSSFSSIVNNTKQGQTPIAHHHHS